MTNSEKNTILSMKEQNYSFNAIAKSTGLPIGTIKSFLSRDNAQKKLGAVESKEQTIDNCRQCGLPLVQGEHRKQRAFCSDRCRMIYWNDHRDLSQRPSAHLQQCEVCGESFYTYKGHYCSRACAGKARTLKACALHE